MARKDISVANFKLLNLNLPDQLIHDDEGWSDAQYDAKVAFSERVLDDIDADIIGFQECWDAKALAEILDQPRRCGRYDLVARTTDPPDIQVAMAMRKGCRISLLCQKHGGQQIGHGSLHGRKLQQLRSFRHVYYTYIFQNQMESLDHIMVSDSFYDHSPIRKWSFREMRMLNDHLIATEAQRKRLGHNDHGIIVARSDWNPMVEEAERILAEEGSAA